MSRGLSPRQAAALGITVSGAATPAQKRPSRKAIAAMTPPPPIIITVAGEPIPQPRHDAQVIWAGGKPSARMFCPGVRRKVGEKPNGKPILGPDLLEPWRDAVKRAARPKIQMCWLGPVVVNITWYFPRPDYLLIPSAPVRAIPHTVKCDRDNLDKAILDALSETRVWGNDAQVYDGRISKFFVAKGYSPGARIEIIFESSDYSEGTQLTFDQEAA